MKYDVVVVGAGQAGLAMGYYLKQTGLSFILVDGNERVGDSWRNRYESLVLFTPRSYSSLPGLKMKGEQGEFPTKDEMAQYLEEYVHHFQLPVQQKTLVQTISRNKDCFDIKTNSGIMKAKQVVIASGAFQKPFIPPVITKKMDGVLHLHSSNYVSPTQIPSGSVLVVGGGNSGAQIAVELAQKRKVTLAISQAFKFLPLHLLGKSFFYWLEIIGLLYAGIDTKRGQWLRNQRDPIFGYELKKMIAEERITIKERVVQADGKVISFQDQSKEEYETIIWATGFAPSYDWIEIEGAVSSDGKPIHSRGVSSINGLYFIGLPWQYQRGSALICGVGRDAQHLVPYIRNTAQK